ncbi:MAG: TRAP transporter substrate-binding protein [Bernardetiaceae bacterium]|jgi:TRAP-type mannitol/chloroaromatic compound transport system substrate-binding protein|nr:TRAP transporter substrate-binding protein [Bernardetiaceae bacterium]
MHLPRRQFLQQSALALAATGVTLSGCTSGPTTTPAGPLTSPYDPAKAQFKWKMVTTWPPHFPSLGQGVDLFAQWVFQMSGGRLHIHVYGANELVPAYEVFEAVSLGAVQLGHGAPYYWSGKMAACQFFASIPFGMNSQQMVAWILRGGGLELWREVYAPFKVIPFLAGTTGMQYGGWFKKTIDSMADWKGLLIRMPGLGGKIVQKAGATTISLPGGELYTSLERGVIDAADWIGPYHDYLLGLFRVAKYYYYPGWQETGTPLEMIVNQAAFQSLPPDLQAIIEGATARLHDWIFMETEVKNAEHLQKLVKEEKVEVRRFPDEVLTGLHRHALEVYAELTQSDPLSKKVYQSYESFRQTITNWHASTEKVYYEQIQATKGLPV